MSVVFSSNIYFFKLMLFLEKFQLIFFLDNYFKLGMLKVDFCFVICYIEF